MTSALRATVLSIMAAMLGACGGGGGGGSGSPTPIPPAPAPAPAPNQNPAQNQTPAPDQTTQRQNTPPGDTQRTDTAFTSFSAVQPNQNVIMNGSATWVSRTQGGVIEADGGTATAKRSGTLNLGFDSQRSLTAVNITAPEGSVSFDQSAGHSISCSGGGVCTASNHATASAVIGDAFANGWNYQTYGAWAIQSNPTTLVVGAVSAGTATPGNAVPTTGSANFSGTTSGNFIDTAGIRFTTSAQMTASVDFQNRAIGFNTLGTGLVNSTTGAATSNANLDLNGSLSWAPGVNNFSGSVQTRDRTMVGAASGKFYGPKAEEIGGTYNLLSGSGRPDRMVGGFGGKQQ